MTAVLPSGPIAMPLERTLKLRLHRAMSRIRAVEESIVDHYPEQEMRCPVHLSIGQEATAVGACAALEASDYVLSGHRSHGHYLAKGGDLKSMMAEIYGKAAGCAGGKGGSMHLIDLEVGFLGAAPIVGTTIPIAAGVAFATKMRREKRVTMVFLGDGATETGAFYEAINFAALKELPIVFLVENNLFSVYSRIDVRQKGGNRVVDLARAHGIPAEHGDGNDVEAVYRLSSAAVERARSGAGPTLLEFMTYRWREHCGPNYDNQLGYRTETEFQQWKSRCPIDVYERQLVADDVAAPGALDAVHKAERAEAEAAVAYARSCPWPAAEVIATHIYAERQLDEP